MTNGASTVRWTVPCRGRLTSPYGPRTAPVPGATTWHRGVDIAPPVRGQRAPVDVHSVGAGRVRATGRDAERGVWVVIFHEDGSATTYQHLATRLVSAGMRVDAGATLGVMGATGTDAGVHLHLETFPDAGDWIQRGTSWRSIAAGDPEAYMSARGVDLRDAIAVSAPVLDLPDVPAVPLTGSLPAPLTPEDTMRTTLITLAGGGPAAWDVIPGVCRRHVTAEELAAWQAAGDRVEVVEVAGDNDVWSLPIAGSSPGDYIRARGTAEVYVIGPGRLEHIDAARYAAIGSPQVVDVAPDNSIFRLPRA